MWEKKKTADCQHFLLFPQVFQKPFSVWFLNNYQTTKIVDWSKLKQIADNILFHYHTFAAF